MKNGWNILLLAAVILPLVLLLWPFAQWGAAASLLLRVIPALAAQTLLCRVGKYPLARLLPALLTGAMAVWGICLYCTSPHWVNATVGGLLADYVSPFFACAVVLIVFALEKRGRCQG